jgi:hypothetical protein
MRRRLNDMDGSNSADRSSLMPKGYKSDLCSPEVAFAEVISTNEPMRN